MCRIFPIACFLPAVLGLAGCEQLSSAQEHQSRAVPAQEPRSEQTGPIITGEFISGTLWNKPVGEAGSNQGGSPHRGSRVEVYENFIIVTDPNGQRRYSRKSCSREMKKGGVSC